jgi:hypothetical protein
MKPLFTIAMTFLALCVTAQKIPDYSYTKEIPLEADGFTVLAEVYVSEKEIKTENDKFYCWVKAKEVHTTQGGYEGRLLHGAYSEFYNDNNIKQKGEFKNGLRSGEWKSWYQNGNLQEITHWKDGRLSGSFTRYSEDGKITEDGKFCKGAFDGKVNRYDSTGAATKINYKDGIEQKPKEKKVKKKKPEIVPLAEEEKTDTLTKINDKKSEKKAKEKDIKEETENTGKEKKKTKKVPEGEIKVEEEKKEKKK